MSKTVQTPEEKNCPSTAFSVSGKGQRRVSQISCSIPQILESSLTSSISHCHEQASGSTML